jgi:hypothetical protein
MGKKGQTKYDNIFVTGQKYGKWVVIDGIPVIDKEAKILCKCTECNVTEKYVPAYQLVTGVSKRCSVCGYSNKLDQNPSWRGFGKIPGSKLSRIINGAKNREIEFNLEISYLSELYNNQKGLCYYTKIPIEFSDNTASLERLNSSLGYLKDNVVWVHKNLNIMKRDLSFDDFLKICRMVVNNFEDYKK